MKRPSGTRFFRRPSRARLRVVTNLRDMGRRIAEERERAGYTQAELAERIGLSEKALQRIELGAPTSTQRLLDIARSLGVDGAVFFVKPANRKRRVGRPRKR